MILVPFGKTNWILTARLCEQQNSSVKFCGMNTPWFVCVTYPSLRSASLTAGSASIVARCRASAGVGFGSVGRLLFGNTLGSRAFGPGCNATTCGGLGALRSETSGLSDAGGPRLTAATTLGSAGAEAGLPDAESAAWCGAVGSRLASASGSSLSTTRRASRGSNPRAEKDTSASGTLSAARAELAWGG